MNKLGTTLLADDNASLMPLLFKQIRRSCEIRMHKQSTAAHHSTAQHSRKAQHSSSRSLLLHRSHSGSCCGLLDVSQVLCNRCIDSTAITGASSSRIWNEGRSRSETQLLKHLQVGVTLIVFGCEQLITIKDAVGSGHETHRLQAVVTSMTSCGLAMGLDWLL